MKEITFKIIEIFRPHIDRWIVKTFITSGLALIVTGLTGISWYVQLFLHIIEIESEKRLGQNYSIGIIDWTVVIIGFIITFIGLIIHYVNKRFDAKSMTKKKLFVAIIHKSIDNFIKPNYSKFDNFKIENYQIQEIEIDQTMIYKNGNLEYPEASLFHQNDILSKIKALTDNNNDFEIAYFGLAHIPVIWDLGSSIADKFRIDYYEYDRHSNNWKKLIMSSNSTENLFISDTVIKDSTSKDAIIKFEISYEIENADILQVVANHKNFTTIKLNSIGLDKIIDLNQIDTLTKFFRKEIDNLIKDSKIENIHIFYSGPVSLALSLSRKISKRTDPNFIVYNYTRNTVPKYKWAVKISSNNPEILKY